MPGKNIASSRLDSLQTSKVVQKRCQDGMRRARIELRINASGTKQICRDGDHDNGVYDEYRDDAIRISTVDRNILMVVAMVMLMLMLN